MPYKYILICMCAALLSACSPPKNLTMDEMMLKEAYADCKKDADEMSDPPRNSDNRFWDSYFTMCMKTRYGYTSEQVRGMWR